MSRSFQYTIDDTPDVVRRIERDLDMVRSAVRDADPRAKSLVLTGGFARGEGAMLDGQPQNDYDFVVFRGLGRPNTPYTAIKDDLERRIGIHIDLAPVPTWRIPFLSRSIFWYETAMRGKVLWGRDLLAKIRVRDPSRLDRGEALRLLVNRAAGLLLSSESKDAHLRRIQAAKAFLAAADAHLLSEGEFPPTQTERWQRLQTLWAAGQKTAWLDPEWIGWAYRFKVDPATAPARADGEAWRVAAKTLLAAVPAALRFARLSTLEDYARLDGVIDHLVYYKRSRRLPGARSLVRHPTGRVRVGTLRLLEASLDGRIPADEARRQLGPMTRNVDEPIGTLNALRSATLQ